MYNFRGNFMNKKNVLLTVLCALSTAQITLPAEPEQSEKGWKKIAKIYATSLTAGGVIGSATGILSLQAIITSLKTAEYLMAKPNNEPGVFIFGLMVPTLVLIAERRLRSTLTEDLNKNFEENEINHSKNLICDTAWITSWVAFLACLKLCE